MALEYRKRFKQKLDKIKPDIIDDSAASSDFFNIVDIPPFLGYGKNSIRIAGSTTNLLQPNSQIQVEVIDSAGNPIYYEIPNKSYSDGSRVITIWVYNDRDNPKENTAPGMATITIIGTAKSTVPSNVSYGGSGSGSGRGYNESPALPPDVVASGRGRGKDRLRRRKNEPLPGKIVKWQKQIPVVIEDASPATLEFESPFIPTATVSASLRPYTNFQLETGEDPLLLGVNSKLAFRSFFGIAAPFGNSNSIPFSKSFFAGGSNDNRAWEVYRLGPGSSGALSEFNEANMKIAFNIEYRFKIIGKLDGAIFTDIGNIWNVFDDTKDSKRTFDGFKDLNELAIGSGFGMRYNLGYFILRLDAGFKTYNPVLENKDRWFTDFNLKKAVFNIGLNYPF